MVAKITLPASVKRALNYNEQKVKEGKATCLLANGFLKEAEGLNFYEKLSRFEHQIALNQRASTNTLHISLNFAEGEHLSTETLSAIARDYMNGIGFENQPYLAYQHVDAGHPHLHIVTTNIEANGKRIPVHNLGKNQSSTVRKEIESKFGLKQAEKSKGDSLWADPLLGRKVVYGTAPTKRAITNVLDVVLPGYKYTSLPELNAVLGLYNIRADRGGKESRIFKTGGLVYRMLDSKGLPAGVPIKASSIYSKPTLKKLEEHFQKNRELRQQHTKSATTRVDWALATNPKTIESFKKALQKENILLVTRQNDQGILYGLTYIDLHQKCVFNGSDLGKRYSANAVGFAIATKSESAGQTIAKKSLGSKEESRPVEIKEPGLKTGEGIIDSLIQPEQFTAPVPLELRKKKRRRKQKPS